MEPGAPRPHVVGENEALQQFFNGHDVSGVLDNHTPVAVDTRIFEQYLNADMCSSNFTLPESPPDSSSEAFSPVQIPDCQYEPSLWCTQQIFAPASSSCQFKGSPVPQTEPLTHEQLRNMGLTNIYIKPGTPPAVPAGHSQFLNQEGCLQGSSQPPPMCSSFSPQYTTQCNEQQAYPSSSYCQTPTSAAHSCSPERRKRRKSDCEEASRPKAPYEVNTSVSSSISSFSLGSYSSLTWDQYTPGQWSELFDSNFQSLSPLAYHVDTDKGFTYSAADEAFVCQKKNHFQVTVQIGVSGEPRYVRTPRGSQEVDHFEINVFGIKLEDHSHHVLIEQSQSDRSKKPFYPVRVSLPSRKITKVTLGRLHFNETTSNNIRKKGKPNPDQRYFQMVVGLYAAVKEEKFLLTALMSERIIVRASNPGQFETDGDSTWQRGAMQDTVVCHGRVGINTDSPDEALVVCGNAKVMGSIMQPSDQRAKHNIKEVDSEQQLKRITQMRIVEFDYKPQFAASMGIDKAHQTGVIAQEVKELLPSAVREVGDVTCAGGEKIDNFLMVDKEQIFMENIGAVQQLSKVTDNLETRIEELEVWNKRLSKLKNLTGSLRSHRKNSNVPATPTSIPAKSQKTMKDEKSHKFSHWLQHRIFQASVFTLLTTVAFSIITITAVYLVTLEEDKDLPHGHSNSSLIPPVSTAWSSTVMPTSPPESWPPDINVCELLYCDQVYCCPSPGGGGTGFNITLSESWSDKYNLTEIRIQHFYELLKSAKDWTNTTIQNFMIKETQQIIDSKYCLRDECGPSRFVYRVPISQFVPGNMRITLLMNSTELLVVHLCHFDESAACSARLDMNTVTGSAYPTNTQGEHEWPLHVARLRHSSYHFRSSVAGQADCNTDHHYAGVLFTDYHFHFYRRCID